MRIHQVSMTGFGPFRQTQTVDLDRFADHGIFLITGRTGAGKSSILDAIVYALYDAAPRYATAGGKQVRSTHCAPDEPSRVELVFSAGDQTYRIIRTPEYLRPKARGTGFTTEKATAELARREGDQWVGIASQLRTVGEELHHIVPLSCDQFLQVVLLAQGQFQRFLVASSDERQQLLRTLFRSDRFRDYDTHLQQRAGALRQQLSLVESGIAATVAALAEHAGREVPQEPDEDWLGEVLDAHDADLEIARADLKQADKEVQAAHELLHEATGLADKQRRRAEADQQLARLMAERPVIEADRRRRDLALAAQSVDLVHAGVLSSTQRADAAAVALDQAAARFAEAVPGPVPADLVTHRDEATSQLAVLRDRLADEQELERLRDEAETLGHQLEVVARRADELAEEALAHDAVLTAPVEITVDQAQSVLDRLLEELDLAAQRDRTRAALAEAEVEQLRRGRARTAASTDLDRLRERRLAEYAGTLAAELVDGQACAVCGSADHPEPARAPGEPVTEAMLESAQEVLDEAERRAREAAERVVALRTTLEGWAQVRGADELTVLVTDARATVSEVERAEQEREASRTARQRIDTEITTLGVRRAKLEQRSEHVGQRIDRLASRVEEARADAGSVVERIAVLTRHVEAATALIDARAADAAARQRLAECREAFESSLRHHEFDDAPSFLAARTDERTITELTRRIQAHDRALAGAEETLAAPELQDLPAEPVDVDGPRAAHAEAKAACEAASKRCGAAESCARTSHDLAAAIRGAWGRNAQARADFQVVDRLARSLHGESPNTRRMRLESYVLGVELEQIVAAANVRLHAMSSGRYALERSDAIATRGSNGGLEVRVRDQYTSVSRTPESLSGGEKFLASLALALGLAEVVTNRAGGITLDTLFIDEGFGSLDAETLDVAMETLDSLRQNGRTIGLISHVETMKERIPAQLAVEKTAQGCSRVRVRA
ncbi:SMC family ATPase [Aeromicrobium senzhongii]|uniref:Nuclease SbcCD subunit C n=1 Tax=Aeromicrobium senzhongii TaxID=2663859 RepID=A0ABX6SR79_9ACTN|nr:SMC family ATPase [Aeromicrobium senzhongii]MTB89115.1 AAA family ATPase [Aeromicrobium senzhongii]QNL93617.1 SMC family ATPase [Aeromicrobium senzhongii]